MGIITIRIHYLINLSINLLKKSKTFNLVNNLMRIDKRLTINFKVMGRK